MLIIPALGRLRQEDPEFKAILGCILRLCLRQNKTEQQQQKELEIVFLE
jgi:hypothetical protein